MEDIQILDLYWSRSQTAITETANKYGSYCRTIAFGILQNTQDTEESLNDTWFAAWEAIPPTRPNSLGAFLARLTRSISIDKWRLRTAEKRGSGRVTVALEELAESMPAQQDVSCQVEERELARSVNRFLESLPTQEREVFLLRYFFILTQTEIGRRTGLTPSRIKTSLARSRKGLMLHLKKEGLL